MTSTSAPLATWYRNTRPLLEQLSFPHLAYWDQLIAGAEPKTGRFTQPIVCVLGESGVGKSSLVNALISEQLPVLPGGGVGPLTASPIIVRWAQEPWFSAQCLGPDVIEGMLDAIEDRTSFLPPSSRDPRCVTPFATRERHQNQRLARLLIAGNQFGSLDRTHLADCLLACLDVEHPIPARATVEERDRIEAARICLTTAATSYPFLRHDAGSDLPGFLAAVNRYGAGFLAPITTDLQIGWCSPLLEEGFVLVDLPGLGVANDELPRTAESWIRRAQVVLVVVDRSGMSEATAKLLRRAGIFESLVGAPRDDPTAAPELMVAIVKLDLPAEETYRQKRQAMGRGAVRWQDCLNEKFDAARAFMTRQIGLELSAAARRMAPAKADEAVACASKGLHIHPVLPREFQGCHRADPDEPSRLRSPAGSRIPMLMNDLVTAAQRTRIDLASHMLGVLGDWLDDLAPGSDERSRVNEIVGELIAIQSEAPTTYPVHPVVENIHDAAR